MTRSVSEFFMDILEYNGSVIEKLDGGVLEALLTPEASKTLEIPEHTRLCFSYDEAQGKNIYASYDSEIFKTSVRLLSGRGRYALGLFEAPAQNLSKLVHLVESRISFHNAVFRLENTETRKIPYLLTVFRYTALSDEKHEGIVTVLLNTENLSVAAMPEGMSGILDRLKESDTVNPVESLPTIPEKDMERLFRAAHCAAMGMVKARLAEFVKSLDRRLNRDARRVFEYYDTMKGETIKAIKKNAVKEGGDIDKQIQEKTVKGEGIDRLLSKLDAIDAERKWKVRDLVSKYSLNIKVEPVSAISIIADLPVFTVKIKRRLASRDFPVTYNPIVRHLDPLPCESCFSPGHGHYV
ncbi:MAG: hypothetical protein HY786_05710, partial [Deltaproteobacteria bacterium]|nr:hypothetical protein [Deltaproteobacteria bacterium]